MSTEPKSYVSEMDLDEISSVLKGDNTGADILIVKNMPGAQDVHHEDTLDGSFKHKKRGKKGIKRMRDDCYDAIDKMGREEAHDQSHRRLR